MKIQWELRMRAVLGAVLLMSTLPASGQWVTQSFDLKAGWNAIFTHVDASHTSLDAMIARDANNPIQEVWLWQPSASSAQFITSPQEPIGTGSAWVSWSRATGPAERKLYGNAAYLVKVGPGSAAFKWNVLGKPVPPRYQWTSKGLNFIGFSTVPSGAPSFESFLSQAPELSLRAEIFRYPGGELGPSNPALVSSLKRTTTVARGEAFWIRAPNHFNRYFAPFEIDLQSASGVEFGDSSGQHRVRIRNLTGQNLEVRLSFLTSEAPPAGQRAVAGKPPLIIRGDLDLNTLLYRYAPLDGVQSWTLKPAGQKGSEAEIILGLKRTAMAGSAGDLFAGILRFADNLSFSQMDVPVSAELGATSGLWVGAASVQQVRSYLPSYQRNASGQLSVAPDGKYVSTGINTNLGPVARPFPLRLIIHKDGTGASKLLQRVYFGLNPSNQVLVATKEAPLDPKHLASARRISAAHLPFAAANPSWSMTGNLALGGTLKATIPLSYADQGSNPFLHTYHPDHDNFNERFSTALARGEESYDVQRQIELNFTPPATDDFASASAGNQTLSGSYKETLTFLGKGTEARQFETQGFFVLNRVSSITTLTTP